MTSVPKNSSVIIQRPHKSQMFSSLGVLSKHEKTSRINQCLFLSFYLNCKFKFFTTIFLCLSLMLSFPWRENSCIKKTYLPDRSPQRFLATGPVQNKSENSSFCARSGGTANDLKLACVGSEDFHFTACPRVAVWATFKTVNPSIR